MDDINDVTNTAVVQFIIYKVVSAFDCNCFNELVCKYFSNQSLPFPATIEKEVSIVDKRIKIKL